jgi:hypothetical protein
MSKKSNLRQIYDLLSETYPTATNIIIEVWPGGVKADVTTREYEFIQQEKQEGKTKVRGFRW